MLRKTLKRLVVEERGVVISAELVLFSAVVVIGMLVGLQTVRNAVVTELGDFAAAVGTLNQSYSFAAVTGHHSSSAGSFLVDVRDDCDNPAFNPLNPAPALQCIGVAISASHEN